MVDCTDDNDSDEISDESECDDESVDDNNNEHCINNENIVVEETQMACKSSDDDFESKDLLVDSGCTSHCLTYCE